MKTVLQQFQDRRHELGRQRQIGRLSQSEHDSAILRAQDEFRSTLGGRAGEVGGRLQRLFSDPRRTAADRFKDAYWSASSVNPDHVRYYRDLAVQDLDSGLSPVAIRTAALRSGDKARVLGASLASTSVRVFSPEDLIAKNRLAGVKDDFLNADPAYQQARLEQHTVVEEIKQSIRDLHEAGSSDIGGAPANPLFGARGDVGTAAYVASFFTIEGNAAVFTPLEGPPQYAADHGVMDAMPATPVG